MFDPDRLRDGVHVWSVVLVGGTWVFSEKVFFSAIHTVTPMC